MLRSSVYTADFVCIFLQATFYFEFGNFVKMYRSIIYDPNHKFYFSTYGSNNMIFYFYNIYSLFLSSYLFPL